MSKSTDQRLSTVEKHDVVPVNKGGKPNIGGSLIVRPVLVNASAKENPAYSEHDAGSLIDPCFWTAWNSHREYLRRLSYVWMNVSSADAEDALSAATIRAFEKYGAHASQISNERAWFARLLHNICIDIHRSNKRRFNLSEKVKEVVSIDISESENVDVTPEAELLNSELGNTLVRAIRDLPDKLQEPLIMRLVKGEEYDFIAMSLDISNDNARKRVQQARAILRKKLAFLKD